MLVTTAQNSLMSLGKRELVLVTLINFGVGLRCKSSIMSQTHLISSKVALNSVHQGAGVSGREILRVFEAR